MTRNSPLPAALVIFLSASLAGAADLPNVLFIAVDDLRPEIASFGAEQMVTPQLDRLARQGVRFDRAFCMVPTCPSLRPGATSRNIPSPA